MKIKQVETLVNPTTSEQSSLFPPNFKYLDCFRFYRKVILDFISGASEKSPTNLFTSLQSRIEKATFLEAAEYGKMKSQVIETRIKELYDKILLSQGATALGKNPQLNDSKIKSLLIHYQYDLQVAIDSSAERKERDLLQQASDVCLVLLTSIEAFFNRDSSDKSAFLRWPDESAVYGCTQKTLYDKNLTWLKTWKEASLKGLWEIIYVGLHKRLDINKLLLLKQAAELELQETNKRYQCLIDGFKSHLLMQMPIRWKQQWLYAGDMPTYRFGGKSGVTVNGFFHLAQANTPGRFKVFESLISDISGLLGSTYFSAGKSFLEESTLCLDANYQSGSAGATSDGYGHFLNKDDNLQVQITAYRTVKLAVRYANFYSSPEMLYHDVPKIFSQLRQAVKQSFLHPEAAGTASCALTKVFSIAEDKKIVVAAGVGDGMVVAFSPQLGKLKVLLKPRQYNRGSQFTPMSITESLTGDMLSCVMEALPSDAFLIRMTDGAWELLPHLCTGKLWDEKAKKEYLEYTLDIPFLAPLLQKFAYEAPDASAAAYRAFLQKLMQEKLAIKKQFLVTYQAMTQATLNQFPAGKSSTLADFIHWAEKTDRHFHQLLIDGMKQLNYSAQELQLILLSEFAKKLETVSIGDDITLHVERLSQVENKGLQLK